jgi:opacity protein-like surface antigen
MNHCTATKTLTTVLAGILSVTVLLPGSATAEPQDDDWHFTAALYGWLPSIGGESNFPPSSGGSSSMSVSADDILDSLDGVFMGEFVASKGRWGGFIDLIYLDLENKKSSTRSVDFTDFDIPAGASLGAKMQLTGWTFTTAGTYDLVQKPGYNLELLGGVRYLDLEEEIKWSFSGNVGQIPLQSRSGKSSADEDYWDAVVGVRGRAALGSTKWFIPYYLDVGTGDSDFTWQAMAGIGYSFDSFNVVAAYRYLDWNFGSGKAIEDLNFGGPLIGASYSW